jgi:hypothetical protein
MEKQVVNILCSFVFSFLPWQEGVVAEEAAKGPKRRKGLKFNITGMCASVVFSCVRNLIGG